MPQPSKSKDVPVTYGDYRQWTDDGRWEIIEGIVYDMSPSPSTKHQTVLRELLFQIASFLPDDSNCEVFIAPFDIRLPEADEPDDAVINVVQPDLSMICDPLKIDEIGCRGAPDWVIEVLSPHTASKDHIQKRLLYERKGVREYWLVHPLDEMVTVFVLGNDGKYELPVFREGKGELGVKALPGLVVDLDAIYR